MAAVVQVRDLQKRYRGSSFNAIDGISFDVFQGEVFALLGPNGAGKTTTVGVLTTRVEPSGGEALIGGYNVASDPVAVKRLIGVVPQRSNLDRSLTVLENLTFHAAYFGFGRAARVKRARMLLEEFGLADRSGEKVDSYSGGMVQRVMIARALMHEPSVLFLDEPTVGLDPQARLFLWDRIGELKSRGVTVVLTTQYMDEAERLADRVAIMDHGHILAVDTPLCLKRLVPGGTRIVLHVRPGQDTHNLFPHGTLRARLASLDGATEVDLTAGKDGLAVVRLTANRGGDLALEAVQVLWSCGFEARDMQLAEPGLEDVFIHLTGRTLRV
jgi:ABC-2 type transport system ATP-binding protein